MSKQKKLLETIGKDTEISHETCKKIIKEAFELKAKNILFLGGEPFLRQDLFELIDYTKSFGITATIVTNGSLLTEDIIEKCFNSKLDSICVSIDAVSREVFTKIRGSDTLDKIIGNVKKLKLLKEKRKSALPTIAVLCTIMNDNLEELLNVVEFCKENIGSVIFQPVVINNINSNARDFSSSLFVPSERFEILDKAMDGLIEFKKKNPGFIINETRHFRLIKKYFRRQLLAKDAWPCYGGYNRIQINQSHQICFCMPPDGKYEAFFGDVRNYKLKDLWYSKEAMIRRKIIKRCVTPCLQCCSYRNEFVQLKESIFKSRVN